MNCGIEDMLQSNTSKTLGVSATLRIIMKTLASMMTGMMKASS
jgi:hypothetical protein